ncbi:MAG: hypothetical protein CVU55_05150 [Deltaproteobacteria bacterium HGW-Deltaproteobacteria-13]|jgi:hypothetical protein|nr:MAG: hypothetical protein CVU55_05150 [Deltaproteobacteria bacterium HGW-Deltaproteobacteria-13]
MIDRLFNPILDVLDSNPYLGTIIIAFVIILIGVVFPPSLILFVVFIGYGVYLKFKRAGNQKKESKLKG